MNWDLHWNGDVANMHSAHAEKASQIGGLSTQLIDNYRFHSYDPDKRTVPVSAEKLNPDWMSPQHDTLRLYSRNTNRELMQDGFERGWQALTQQQSIAVSNRRRGIATTFTRELSHPLGGEETRTLNYSYMPSYPTDQQVRQATRLASELQSFTDHHRQGEQYFYNAPGQSFRHEPSF